ncbi:MAG: hypothetical protein ACLQVL_23060 [Terriglobia bacterium]
MSIMKVPVLVAALLGVVLAVNTKVEAAEVRNLKLSRPMVVAGVDLQAAVYTVQWDIQGARATVTFSRKGHVVATVQGKCATFGLSAASDTFYFSKNPNGFLAISALGFAGSNKGILFPLVRSHPHHSSDIPPDNSLMDDGWTNSAPRVPQVFR